MTLEQTGFSARITPVFFPREMCSRACSHSDISQPDSNSLAIDENRADGGAGQVAPGRHGSTFSDRKERT